MKLQDNNSSSISFELSDDQNAALQLMLNGKSVFLTGSAGTGKTSVIRAFREKYQGNCAVVAPTGIAALNVEGQTIHSFFMLPPCLLVPENIDRIPWPRKREIIRQVDCLIIDEISMVRSDMFVAIDRRMRECASKKGRNLPFGGKQVIVCGDFFQLPPVVANEVEEQWLEANLGGEYAFQTKLWEAMNFNVVSLSDPFRQKSDATFVKMLNDVRHGNVVCRKTYENGVEESPIEALNSRCAIEKKMASYPIRLCTTNREAQMVNNNERAKIQSDPIKFVAIVKGKFNEQDYPTEAELILKVGCRVMVLKNCRHPKGGFIYVNGDCGEVTAMDADGELSRVKVKLDNGNEVWIHCNEWKNMKYVVELDAFSGKKIIRQDEIGSFVQLPLRLAYATTIHKSQGMTLDNVDIRLGNGCFAHGQLYTALSRARTLSGLHLERPIFAEDLILDDRVVDFYNALEYDPFEQMCQQTKTLDVPVDCYDKVKEMLEQMKREKQVSVSQTV